MRRARAVRDVPRGPVLPAIALIRDECQNAFGTEECDATDLVDRLLMEAGFACHWIW